MVGTRTLLCVSLLARAAGVAAAPDGPLGVTTPGTFRQLFLEMPLLDARPVGGAGRLDVRWWLANDWAVPTRLSKGNRVVLVEQDEQVDVLQLTAILPWSRFSAGAWATRWQTSVELRVIEHWGGWTDHPIERWHQLVGSWDFQRDRHRHDAVHLKLGEEGGATLAEVHHGQLALGDLALRTQALLVRGAPRLDATVPWAMALRADLKLPTGRLALLGGSGGIDAGLGLAWTVAPVRWLTLHGQGAVRLVSPLPRGFPLQPEPVQWGVDLSLVLRPWRRVALLVEDRVSSPLFRGGWAFATPVDEPEATAFYGMFRPYNQLPGGLRMGGVTVFLAEDYTPGKRLPGDRGARGFYNSNSPDVMVGVALARGL